VHLFRERAVVDDRAVGAGILQQHAEDALVDGELARVTHRDGHPACRGPRGHHGNRLRMAVGGHQQHVLGRAPLGGEGQRHGLGCRRALVEQRGVGNLQPGEIDHHGLVVEQRFEPPLSDLGLVGRVRRVPGRILHDVAQDHIGRVRAMVAHADERAVHLVPGRDLPQRRQDLRFRALRPGVQRAAKADLLRDHRVDEGVERVVAERGEHLLLFGPTGTDVTRNERIVRGDRGRDGAGGHDHPREKSGNATRSRSVVATEYERERGAAPAWRRCLRDIPQPR